MAFNVHFYNIIMHSVAFMCLFTAFQTACGYNATYLSYKGAAFNDVGFNSLAIIYVVFSMAGFLSAPLVEIFGSKWSMFFAAFTYAGFIATYYHPLVPTIYCASVLLGFGASVLWTAQGKFMGENSDDSNRGKYAGLFWAILQSSLLWGNLLGAFVLPAKSEGEEKLLKFFKMFYLVLTFSACAGVVLMVFLRSSKKKNSEELSVTGEVVADRPSVLQLFVSTFKLLANTEMLLLGLLIIYSGLELQMWSSNYPTIFGKVFSPRDIGFSGICVAAGEIIGGLTMGRLSDRYGKSWPVMLALMLHTAAFYLIYCNFLGVPWNSLGVGLLCSFLLGLGDSSINTAINSILLSRFPDQNSQAFALLKFFQSGACGIAFFYSDYVPFQYQLIIDMFFLLVGVAGFIKVDSKEGFRSSYTPIKPTKS